MSVPDPAAVDWVPLRGVGASIPPVVNGQWVKGAGGLPVWSPIIETDVRGLVVADTAWVPVTAFLNGWVNYNPASYPPARCRRLASGLIVWAGLIQGGTSPGDIFTIPAGYTSSNYLHIRSVAWDLVCSIRPGASTMQVSTPNVGWVSLDGVGYWP